MTKPKETKLQEIKRKAAEAAAAAAAAPVAAAAPIAAATPVAAAAPVAVSTADAPDASAASAAPAATLSKKDKKASLTPEQAAQKRNDYCKANPNDKTAVPNGISCADYCAKPDSNCVTPKAKAPFKP